jgi:tetratricopeptide (TPR) repeat protein
MRRQKQSTALIAALLALSGLLPANAQSDRVDRINLTDLKGATGDPDALLQDGTLALRANHLDEAIAKFQAACQIAPNMGDAHHQWGIALVKAGRPTEAIEQFKLAITLQPQQAAGWLSLGGAYQAAGSVKDAIDAYNDFVTRFPQDRDVAKVKQLIILLRRELNNPAGAPAINTDNQAISTANLSSSQRDRAPLSKSPTDTKSGADDYYDEVTRNGVLRWPKTQIPLKVYIEEGSNVKGYRPSYPGILMQAFLDWAKATNGQIQVVFVADPMKANIVCKWSAQPEKFKNSAEAGESKLYSDRYGLARGELSILTVATSPSLPLTDNRLRAIVLHEVGHVLGLAGHTTDAQDAMFYSASMSDHWRELSVRDKATIAHLYRDDDR